MVARVENIRKITHITKLAALLRAARTRLAFHNIHLPLECS